MSLVDCHSMSMLRSVMRALTHPEAHALRGQRSSEQSSTAALVVRHRRDHGTRPLAVEPCVVRTTMEGHSTLSRSRSIRGRRMLGTAPLNVPTAHPFSPAELERLKAYRLAVQAGFYSDWR
jgi:hypothetical protein